MRYSTVLKSNIFVPRCPVACARGLPCRGVRPFLCRGDGPSRGSSRRLSEFTRLAYKQSVPTRTGGAPAFVCRGWVGCSDRAAGSGKVAAARHVRGPGRLAQRESASFTPKRSLVRSQYRPPHYRRSEPCPGFWARPSPLGHPQKSHTLLADRFVKVRRDRIQI